MRHAVHREQCLTSIPRESDGTFRIGFAGSIYARLEWDALMAALDSVQWRIGGKDVEVWVFGQRLTLQTTERCCVRFFGWRSTDELLAKLSQVDIAYLPYWFDPSRRESVRYCFPTKLGTYLASGLPVLFHGPADSSVATFFQTYPAGLVCDSCEAARLLGCLNRLAEDTFLRSAIKKSREYILESVLNLELFQQQFRTFVGLQVADEGPRAGSPVTCQSSGASA
jgi:hypothetical protein